MLKKMLRTGVLMVACCGAAYAAVAEWDELVGPMAYDARLSLLSGDPAHVLPWIESSERPEATAALAKTMALRARYPEQIDRLDRSFFGTLITLKN